ncbi:MAG: hypothetical protein FWG05_03990 [Kiritimatiellaeota bacterium]|nr:hypothetical protein [Kiritimatiellota bacterium]
MKKLSRGILKKTLAVPAFILGGIAFFALLFLSIAPFLLLTEWDSYGILPYLVHATGIILVIWAIRRKFRVEKREQLADITKSKEKLQGKKTKFHPSKNKYKKHAKWSQIEQTHMPWHYTGDDK